MKKLLISCVASIVMLSSASGIQAAGKSGSGAAFHKGAFFVGPSLGLGSGLGYLGGIAILANAEYAVTDDIGIGGTIGFWSYSQEYSYIFGKYSYSYTVIPIVASGAYHFHLNNNKLDLALGLSLGYYIVSASSSGTGFGASSATGSGIAFGIFGLVRYFVTDTIALRGKLGYGISVIELGVDFRF